MILLFGLKVIPEDYKPVKNPIVLYDWNKTDHKPGVVVVTTIPSKMFTGPLDPDVHSEWIVHDLRKPK